MVPRLLAALALLTLVVLAGGSRADGHNILTDAAPAPDSSRHGPPGEVQLQFALPAVADERTSVTVVAPSGQEIATGDAVVTALGVSQAVTRSEETGWFDVHYRVVVWGGHVDSGDFRFLVQPPDEGVATTTWILVVGGLLTLSTVVVIGRARRTSAAPRTAGNDST